MKSTSTRFFAACLGAVERSVGARDQRLASSTPDSTQPATPIDAVSERERAALA